MVAAGGAALGAAAGGAAASPLRRAASRTADSMQSSFSDGGKSAFEATGGTSTMGTIGGGTAEAAAPADGPPAWARRMKRSQTLSHGVTAAAHAVRSGDSHGGGSSINLSESDR
jgi:type IV secretion system protein TrbL